MFSSVLSRFWLSLFWSFSPPDLDRGAALRARSRAAQSPDQLRPLRDRKFGASAGACPLTQIPASRAKISAGDCTRDFADLRTMDGGGHCFGSYLAQFARNYVTTYAGLASVMVALVFLYMIASIFIFGGELNAAILRAKRKGDGNLKVSELCAEVGECLGGR